MKKEKNKIIKKWGKIILGTSLLSLFLILLIQGIVSAQAPENAPIGIILPWAKSMVGTPALPDGFVEANGQVLNDPGSPYNGQVIPNLNGNQNVLRGNSVSGGTQSMGFDVGTASLCCHAAGGNNYNHAHGVSVSNNPVQYNVVYIMKVK